MTALEAVLFDSGRPVLMAPPAPPKSPLGQTVLIHWNASTETARVIALAMPILRKAKRVSFIAVEGHISPGPERERRRRPPGSQRHRRYREDRDGRNKPGEAILAEGGRRSAPTC
jgi:hypothetical protein